MYAVKTSQSKLVDKETIQNNDQESMNKINILLEIISSNSDIFPYNIVTDLIEMV